MTPDELRAALGKPAASDAAAAATLARDARAETEALPLEAVRLATSGSGVTQQARMLVSRLEELAAGPLLEAPPSDGETEVWMIGVATAAAVSLRGRVAERLRRLLDDRRPLANPPSDPRVEEPVRPRRVCDEAYAMLRELVNVGEDRTGFVMDRWAFFRLAESERDGEIARVVAGQPFRRLLEDREA
jgi:hypothetical protein